MDIDNYYNFFCDCWTYKVPIALGGTDWFLLGQIIWV